ncbi:hypothetical protein FB45DRAFT_43600 [Roridomyces roridus]|uniref:Uncharacterized protein n=1 Tax=Roridomyces roridus TaxID=1738132 RepID=A0AAD7FJZ5_9AGAR|nr:hypothetical protein FB45DRAFT_43600 [Roridomyces roridus]
MKSVCQRLKEESGRNWSGNLSLVWLVLADGHLTSTSLTLMMRHTSPHLRHVESLPALPGSPLPTRSHYALPACSGPPEAFGSVWLTWDTRTYPSSRIYRRTDERLENAPAPPPPWLHIREEGAEHPHAPLPCAALVYSPLPENYHGQVNRYKSEVVPRRLMRLEFKELFCEMPDGLHNQVLPIYSGTCT